MKRFLLSLLLSLAIFPTYSANSILESSKGGGLESLKKKLNVALLGTIPFITTWKTDNPGISNNNQITIPTHALSTYNYTVDWGDLTTPTNHTGNATHTYATAGTYTVSITGLFPRIFFGGISDEQKILTVEQWGDNQWTTMNAAFEDCINLQGNFTDSPDLSNVTNMSRMFTDASSFNYPIGDWDVSNVTNMNSLFFGATSFNQDIGNWNVGNATDMSDMFRVASGFNQDIGNWNVSNVITMRDMFFDAVLFNQNIGGWDVSSVTNMLELFRNAVAFNQDIGNWNVSNVANMYGVFLNTTFNQDISNWVLSSATTTGNMFGGTTAFNQDISGWDVSNVTEMSDMFQDARAFSQDIGGWNVGNVTRMQGMFYRATLFNQDIGGWNTANITNMSSMFSGAISFDQNLGAWDMSNVIYTSNMFNNVTLSTPNYDALLIGWDAQNLQLNNNFHGGNSLYCTGEAARNNMMAVAGDNWTITDGGLDCTSVPFITTWKTDNTTWDPTTVNITTDPAETYNYTIDWGDGNVDNGVTGDATHVYATPGTYTVSISGIFPRIFLNLVYDRFKIQSVEQWGDIQWSSMESAFESCPYLEVNATDIPDLSNVTSLRSMFAGCRIMTGTTEFSTWDVSTIIDMGSMFISCDLFNQDIGGWDVSQVTNMRAMLQQADSFNQDVGNWNVSNVTDMGSLFALADNFNQNISSWDVSKVTYMNSMFGGTPFNQNIGNWDVSNVWNFKDMFWHAESFNQDVGGWNVGMATNVERMFEGAIAFNQDISSWDVSNVTSMLTMFKDAVSFDQNLGNWNVTALTNASNMFENVALSTPNYDALLIGWNVQNLNQNVSFSGGNSQYCTGKVARENIIGNTFWTITDGGFSGTLANTSIDIVECSSYTLPALSANSTYFTETDGGGTMLNAGDIITTSQNIYIYSTTGTAPNLCTDENIFEVIIGNATEADSPEDVETCGNHALPVLSLGNNYYTETNAGGTLLAAGDEITTSQTVYVYAGAVGCSAENSFVVTIDTPVLVDILENVEDCESYTLPVLPNGNYFTESEGMGTELYANDNITTTQTIYVYFASVTCSDESTFEVTIDPAICEQPTEEEEEACEIEFPNFITPNGDGINDRFEVTNNECGFTGELSIYDRYGKLLFQTRDLSRSWGGTMGGTPLPASDYWYQYIDSSSGKLITKHFALKR